MRVRKILIHVLERIRVEDKNPDNYELVCSDKVWAGVRSPASAFKLGFWAAVPAMHCAVPAAMLCRSVTEIQGMVALRCAGAAGRCFR